MGRSRETSNKKEISKQKEKNRQEKERKKQARKENKRNGNNLAEMIAYVDEFGHITSTPPDLSQRTEIKVEDIEISIPKNKEPDPVETIRKGIVTFFNESKGYGFIKDLNSGESIFVHANALNEPIYEESHVTFEVERGPKGFYAVNINIDKKE